MSDEIKSPTVGQHSPTAGDYSPTAGDSSMTTGQYSPTVGQYSHVSGGPVSAALGVNAMVKAPRIGNALVAVEWCDGEIKSIASGMIDGETLLPDTWYVCKDGKLVPVLEDNTIEERSRT